MFRVLWIYNFDLGLACHDSKIDPIHISGSNFEATVDVDMLGPNGYLSIVDWPLLPFYGLMCGLYVAMGLGWLVVCSMHWRDLLRIQFWIGAVIFLGKDRDIHIECSKQFK